VVFGRPTGANDESPTPSSHALALTFRVRPERGARDIAHRKRNAVPRAAFPEVLCPSTLEEAGSDLHRACLARLCCASRFSQPLDALFRPQPFPPCFMRITPLSFHFQRLSLPGSEDHLTAPFPFVPFAATPPSPASRKLRSHAAASRIFASRKSVPAGSVLPKVPPADPLLALPLVEVFTPPASASCFHEASSHGLLRLTER
jgi:hypothetical protein